MSEERTRMYAEAYAKWLGPPLAPLPCGCIPSKRSLANPIAIGLHHYLCPTHEAEMREAERQAGV